jgi:hypothetical protein
MSIIKDIRASIDTRLDQLDAQAEALDAQLEGTREEALKRIEQQKENLVAALNRVEDLVEDSASAASGELRAAIDHLRVQLALGKADTSNLLSEQEQKIRHAIHALEDRLEHAEEGLEDEISKQSATFVRIANKLRAEFESAELQFALLRGEHRDDIQAGKAALRKNLNELRSGLKSAGHEAGERFEQFETEFGAGLTHIRKAFLQLGKGK